VTFYLSAPGISTLTHSLTDFEQNAALIDMEDYRYNEANITALRLVNVDSSFTQKVVDEMMNYQMRTGVELLTKLQPPYLTV